MHIHTVVRIFNYRIRHDARITIAEFVIFLYYTVLVILIILLHKFLLLEYVQQVAVLIGLFHGALHLAVRQHLVAVHIDLMHLHLVRTRHGYFEYHLVLLAQVVMLPHNHFGILKSFRSIILLDNLFGTRYDVGGKLLPRLEIQPFFQVFYLTTLSTCKGQLAQPRQLSQYYFQPNLIAHYLLGLDLHARIQPLTVKTFHRVGYSLSRHLYPIAHFKTGMTDKQIFVCFGYAGYFYTGHLIRTRECRVYYIRIIDSVGIRQYVQSTGPQRNSQNSQEQIFQDLLHSGILVLALLRERLIKESQI